jgi:hypothetical protein
MRGGRRKEFGSHPYLTRSLLPERKKRIAEEHGGENERRKGMAGHGIRPRPWPPTGPISGFGTPNTPNGEGGGPHAHGRQTKKRKYGEGAAED